MPNRELPSRARYHRQNPCHAFESVQSCRPSRGADAMMCRLTSRRTRLLRGPVRRAEWSSEVRAYPLKAGAPGLFRTELKAAFPAAFGTKTACSTRRLDSIGATRHETVDTGTAVVSRKAARLCGRTASRLKAIVVDRFSDTKREADAWTDAHSEFMMLRVVPAGTRSEPVVR